MMKLKTALLLCVCLFLSMPSNAKIRTIFLNKESRYDDRSLGPTIPIEATYDDELHELTLMLFDEDYSILVEVKDEKGNVIYTDYLMMIDGSKVQIPLEGLAIGKYILSISDGEDNFIGDFVY
ncbi:DUF3244 domain-containing protein [uncultured Bacteroides sp.]|uniref:DUF3244 domain-containing protein n=1 Tax=uncultured Bacteroides sp. TaxID=162156 RepID=UPI002593DC5B|nr:DUF3244 domain-containing protein [uncultured Bacteroides sp.]